MKIMRVHSIVWKINHDKDTLAIDTWTNIYENWHVCDFLTSTPLRISSGEEKKKLIWYFISDASSDR